MASKWKPKVVAVFVPTQWSTLSLWICSVTRDGCTVHVWDVIENVVNIFEKCLMRTTVRNKIEKIQQLKWNCLGKH